MLTFILAALAKAAIPTLSAAGAWLALKLARKVGIETSSVRAVRARLLIESLVRTVVHSLEQSIRPSQGEKLNDAGKSRMKGAAILQIKDLLGEKILQVMKDAGIEAEHIDHYIGHVIEETVYGLEHKKP